MTASRILRSVLPESTWNELSQHRRRIQREVSKRTLHNRGTEVDSHESICDGYKDKRILEVGACPTGRTVARFKKVHHAREVIGVNIAVHESEELYTDCRLEPVDARSTPYPNDYFDLIYSTSAFEHIHHLDLMLTEMFRVLRPGGKLFSHFGPIWSGSYGHHLWLTHESRLYNYWNTPLPPYCHLIMSPEDLASHCREKYPDALSRKIVDYVFTSDEQNKYFFEDYERFVETSNFRVLYFKGYDHPELASRYAAKPFSDTIDLLLKKYSPRRQFMYDGIELLLEKAP